MTIRQFPEMNWRFADTFKQKKIEKKQTLKKRPWKFSTKGLSYYWHQPHTPRFARRVYVEGVGFMVERFWTYPSAISDVDYYHRPVSRIRNPKTKKIHKPYVYY